MTEPNATPPPLGFIAAQTAETTAALVTEMIGPVEAARARLQPAMLQASGAQLPAALVADLMWTAAAVGSMLSNVADAIAAGPDCDERVGAICRDVKGAASTLARDAQRLRDAVSPKPDTVAAAASGGVKVICTVCERPIVTAASVSVLNVFLARAVSQGRIFVVSRHVTTGAPTFYRHAACPAPTDAGDEAGAP